jgi:hypothetical protein
VPKKFRRLVTKWRKGLRNFRRRFVAKTKWVRGYFAAPAKECLESVDCTRFSLVGAAMDLIASPALNIIGRRRVTKCPFVASSSVRGATHFCALLIGLSAAFGAA